MTEATQSPPLAALCGAILRDYCEGTKYVLALSGRPWPCEGSQRPAERPRRVTSESRLGRPPHAVAHTRRALPNPPSFPQTHSPNAKRALLRLSRAHPTSALPHRYLVRDDGRRSCIDGQQSGRPTPRGRAGAKPGLVSGL